MVKKKHPKQHNVHKVARTMVATIVLGNTLLTPISTLAETGQEEEVSVQESASDTLQEHETEEIEVVTDDSSGGEEAVAETVADKGAEEEKNNEVKKSAFTTIDTGAIISAVSEKIADMELDDVLENFGGRKVLEHVLSGQQHTSLPEDEDSLDRYQLDDTFEEIKKNKEIFVEQLLQQYAEFQSSQEEEIINSILENLDSFILVKAYFDRWYAIEIGGQILSDQMYYDFETTDSILEIAEKMKKNADFLQSNLTGQTYRKYLTDHFEENTVVELVENFIFEQTNSRDYDAWFEGFFDGEIFTIDSKYEQLNLSVWEKLKNNLNYTLTTTETRNGTDNFLLPLLNMKNTSNMIIASAPGVIIYSSKNTYGDKYEEKMIKGITNFKHHVELLLDTQTESEKERILQALKTIPVLDSERVSSDTKFDYTDENNHLSNGFFAPLQYTTPLNSKANGKAGYQGVSMIVATVGDNSGTLAHEYHHSTGYIFLNSTRSSDKFGYWNGAYLETISSRFHNHWSNGAGLNWITYESEEYAKDSLSDYSNSADRFQSSSDLQEYFGGYVGLIYALNQVVADVILDLPVEEQVGYIRKWNPEDDTIRTLSADEIRELNLTSTSDLVDNSIGIYDKSIADGTVPSNGWGSSYYSLDSQYFINANGEMPNAQRKFTIQMFDELMSLQDYTGWEAVNKFFSGASPVTNDLEALQYVFDDSSMDYNKFRKMQLDYYGGQVQINGLMYDTYDELVERFKGSLSDLRNVKKQMYAKYMVQTDEFRESIFNDGREVEEIYVVTGDSSHVNVEINGDVKKTSTAGLVEAIKKKFDISKIENLTVNDMTKIDGNGSASYFVDFTSLMSVSLPDVTNMGNNALNGCKNLASVSLPKATTIGTNALRNTSLISVSLPEATTIGATAFYQTANLASVDLPKATTIGAGAFRSTSLASVSLPEAIIIDYNAFYGCTKLTSVDLPKATTVGDNTFYSCTSLKKMDLPAIKSVSSSAFDNSGVEVITTKDGKQEAVKSVLASKGILGIVTDAPELENQTLSEGDSLSLSYLAIINDSLANVKADVSSSWTKDGEEVGMDFTYSVDSITRNDAGRYQGTLNVKYSDGMEMGSFSTNEANITVEGIAEEADMYSEFKLGYWRDYGFVLEGAAGLDGVTFDTKESVKKTVEIVNSDDEIVQSIAAVNTNWYDASNYDGYQAIISADILGSLAEGSYRMQVRMEVDGEEYVSPITEQLASTRGMFIGEYQNSIANIETRSAHTNRIQFGNIMNQMVLSVTPQVSGWNTLVDYRLSDGTRVIDAWIATGFDYSQEHTKELVVKDKEGNEVYRTKVSTWNIKEVFNVPVKAEWERSGVQVLIAPEYQTNDYTCYVVVSDASSEEVAQVKIAF